MKKTTISLLIVLALLTAIISLAHAQQDQTRRVRFARGKHSAILKGGVIRGTRNRYLLGASAGQTMTVHITSVEANAVFIIYAPNGKALEGTDEEKDVTDWTGTLPETGDYVIEVGGTRGNATYTLKVTVK
jgi:hypothetical protein